MKYLIFQCLSIGLLISVFSSGEIYGQGITVNDYSKLQPNDYFTLKLPSLDLLFENAKQAPAYQLALVKKQLEQKNLSKEKRNFLSFFSLRSSYQYGTFSYDATYTDVITPISSSYSTSAQKNYTIGGAISIPLDDLFDLKARIKRQRLNVQTAELEKERTFEQLQQNIIQLYVTANAQLNILKLKAEAVILANTQFEITEKDFANGTVDSGVLSTEKERQSQVLEQFENSKAELNKSLMLLEIIAHTKILMK